MAHKRKYIEITGDSVEFSQHDPHDRSSLQGLALDQLIRTDQVSNLNKCTHFLDMLQRASASSVDALYEQRLQFILECVQHVLGETQEASSITTKHIDAILRKGIYLNLAAEGVQTLQQLSIPSGRVVEQFTLYKTTFERIGSLLTQCTGYEFKGRLVAVARVFIAEAQNTAYRSLVAHYPPAVQQRLIDFAYFQTTIAVCFGCVFLYLLKVSETNLFRLRGRPQPILNKNHKRCLCFLPLSIAHSEQECYRIQLQHLPRPADTWYVFVPASNADATMGHKVDRLLHMLPEAFQQYIRGMFLHKWYLDNSEVDRSAQAVHLDRRGLEDTAFPSLILHIIC